MSKTNLEKWYQDAIAQCGCVVCGSPVQVHHVNDCGRNIGELFVLPLCPYHHEGNDMSIGQTKKPFIKEYGNEVYLMIQLRPVLQTMFPQYHYNLQIIFDIQDMMFSRRRLRAIPPEDQDVN